MTQLDIVDVGHSYAHRVDEAQWALKPLRLTFEAGKTYALVGPSGCGKTTLLNILSGLVRPSQGQVLFDAARVAVPDVDDVQLRHVNALPLKRDRMKASARASLPR